MSRMPRSAHGWLLLGSLLGATPACDSAELDDAEGFAALEAEVEVGASEAGPQCVPTTRVLEPTGVDVMIAIDVGVDRATVREGVGDVVVDADEAHRFGLVLAEAPADADAEPAVELQPHAIAAVMGALPRGVASPDTDADLDAALGRALGRLQPLEGARPAAIVVLTPGADAEMLAGTEVAADADALGVTMHVLDADDADAIRSGLDMVTQALACTFARPDVDEEALEVGLAGRVLPRVDDCDLEDGWALDADGTTLRLCGQACALLEVAGAVELTSTCEA